MKDALDKQVPSLVPILCSLFTPVVLRLAVELSLPVSTNQVCHDRDSDPKRLHARQMLYQMFKYTLVII